MSGVQAAQYLLKHYGLTGVAIERVSGYLTAHYDPQCNILRPSDGAASGFMMAGLLLFSSVTLPVEHNASKRASNSLQDSRQATGRDCEKVWTVLHAAAFIWRDLAGGW
jgi:Zn-dependent membrane protease YugP